ncbi:MAG: hypothetical protein M3Y18_02235 [Candidatus Eremiobacteraeota bacterium]|nr:hypothetical protein [Candidatus Eremiobacteraeota bacterium]
MNRFSAAKAIADTVLYEGYLLYPYTASARKNQQRWQFGVVMPATFAAGGSGEHAHMQTDVLVDGAEAADSVDVLVRFLQVQTRVVQASSGGIFQTVDRLEIDGTPYISWEEAVEREVSATFRFADGEREEPFAFEPTSLTEELLDEHGALRGRIIRETLALRGRIRFATLAQGAMQRLRVRIENDSEPGRNADRATALRSALLSCHTLLASTGRASFVSMMDIPEPATAAAKLCTNEQTWPVLVGETGRDSRYAPMVLSSPIILYDFPANAPQSEGDKFDGTEVDELLNLSILSLSDEEKREARATDPRARTLIDRAQSMSSEHFAQLHGTVKFDEGPAFETEDTQPGVAFLVVDGVRIAKGSKVRLQPSRRADVWDTFLKGKTAHVKGVYEDFERQRYVAVSVDDDPASDMHDWYGRSLFFYPEEIEPIGVTS